MNFESLKDEDRIVPSNFQDPRAESICDIADWPLGAMTELVVDSNVPSAAYLVTMTTVISNFGPFIVVGPHSQAPTIESCVTTK